MRKIQNIAVYINDKSALISLDSGCEGDCIRMDECYRLNIPIEPLDSTDTNLPSQADGTSALEIVGKVKFKAVRDKLVFEYEGYVCKHLNSAILAGGAFMERNYIVQELREKRIKISNKYYIMESSPFCPPSADISIKSVSLTKNVSVAPSDCVRFTIPGNAPPDQSYIVSPHPDSPSNPNWQPQLITAVGNKLLFQNTTANHILIAENTPFIQLTPTKPRENFPLYKTPIIPNYSEEQIDEDNKLTLDERKQILQTIHIEEDLEKKMKEKLNSIHSENIQVFDGNLSNGYNGLSGNHDVNFNFKNNIPPPIHFGCVPCYNKREDDVLMQAMIDRLEAQNIVAKANEIDIIPKFASPCMLVPKNSARLLSKDTYNAMPIKEKLKYKRFVLCQNKLNEYVEKIPHKYNTLEDTIAIVGGYEYVITTDLTDSFWQRPIVKEKLPYFAFHSPFRGTYIFLRSSQGFLNQSEGLEQLITSVLQNCILQGWCRVHADNIYVLGDTQEETIERWQQVLTLMKENNLKLSPKKTSCFPKKLDLLGWTKEGKFLVPDPHRQNCVAVAELPRTVKQLRSYLGSYRTFQKCKENTSEILRDLEEFLAESSSKPNQPLKWSQHLLEQFETSKLKIRDLDKLYLPNRKDQLVLTSDWSKSGISATLWAVVNNKFLVVARMSSRNDSTMTNALPCEGETSAVFVAAKSPTFSLHIKAAKNRTIALVDNKTTFQASKLLQQGKFSSSPLINRLLTSISELNLEFQHLSGKMGQNFTDDFGSRNPSKCKGSEHCKICSFVSECSKISINSVLSFSANEKFIVANLENVVKMPRNKLVQDIISGQLTIPFSNRKAMKFLQDQDPDLRRVRAELTSGQRPQTKNTKINAVKRYLQKDANITIAKDGVLVSHRMDRSFNTKELIVIPQNVSRGLLYGMHLNLNHPTPFQLKKVIETKFYILDRDKIIKEISTRCVLCQSLSEVPKEIEKFKPNQVPDHPGKEFTVDILKLHGKTIAVATDNFSGFLSTAIIKSEKHDSLLEGIILTTTPFRASNLTKIRVDQAPGFRKLITKKLDLEELGIMIDLGEVKNKNALALVDRKMNELHKEIKKLTPANNVIDIKTLAKATNIVNERVRGSGFSSKEILFSRDQWTQENLNLRDEAFVEDTMKKRIKDNEYSSKSKATIKKPAARANANEGQLVFLKQDGSKTNKRDLYLILSTDATTDSITICKLINTFSNKTACLQPHNITYKVKQSDVFLAPNQPIEVQSEVVQVPALWSPPPPHSHRTSPQWTNPRSGTKFKNKIDPIPDSDSDEDDQEDESTEHVETISETHETTDDSTNRSIADPETTIASSDHSSENNGPIPDCQQDEQLNINNPEHLEAEEEVPDYPTEEDLHHHPTWGDLSNMNLNPPLPPIRGATIEFFNIDTRLTVRALVEKTTKTVQLKYPGWFNVKEVGLDTVGSANLGILRWKYVHMPPPVPPPLPPTTPS